MTTRTSLFRTNKTQAVRLPKDVAFPPGVDEVEIVVVGESRVISPASRSWDYWFEHGTRVSDDFMVTRDQPDDQEREAL